MSNRERLLRAIEQFKDFEITFDDYAAWLRSSGSGLGHYLDFEGNWENKLDAWLESIKYCYPEEMHYDLGCSLGEFLKNAVINEVRPLSLPKNDRVVCDQGL